MPEINRCSTLRRFPGTERSTITIAVDADGIGSRQSVIAGQASRIPLLMNEEGKTAMVKKEVMRQMNIKSLDYWDTCCSTMLTPYTLVDNGTGA